MTAPIMKRRPLLTATAPTVTVMRSLASTAYGSYGLQLPEGIDIEDVHDFDVPGNELGYVSSLSRTERVGGLARRFIRADVSVAAADPSDPDLFPESDVDRVLQEAEDRVSSEFFLESDINLAGLNGWIPFVHFSIGDLVDVDIWGTIVTLPVTRIEPIISDHDVVDYRVHVGGQLVSDDEARKAENLALHRAFLQDRRELAGVEGIASQAARTAGEAQQVSSTLDDDLDRSVEVVAGELGLPVPEKEHRLEVSLGEVLAQAIEATQVVQGLAFPQASVVPADGGGRPWWAVGARSSRSEQPPTEAAPSGFADYSYSDFEPDSGDGVGAAYIRISDKVDYKISLWMKGATSDRAYVRLVDEAGVHCVERWQRWAPEQGDWVSGHAVELVPDTDEPSGWGRYEYVVRLKPGTRRVRVSLAPGSSGSPWVNRLAMSVLNRPQEETDQEQDDQLERITGISQRLEDTVARLGRLQNLVIGNTHSNIDYEVQSTAVARNTFVTVYTFTTAIDIVYNIYFRIGWDAAAYDAYRLSIAINGVETYWSQKGRLGPLFPWENGYREMSMTRNGVRLSEGDTITFRVWSNAPNASQRRVRGGVVNMAQVL